jgi:hypothetical protein
VVIHRDAIVRFKGGSESPDEITLQWFGERSGAVLFRMYGHGFLWLDLRSMAIVRHFSCSKYKFVYCPCEMHLSSWAPTLTHTLSFD